MNERGVEERLAAVERELAADHLPDLRALGFWQAVAAVKRDPALVARYADRIASVDRAAFRRAVRLRLPATVGVVLLGAGVIVGLVVLALAPGLARPWLEVALIVGMGALDVATHGLAHVIVGTLAGIRFTDWFVDLPSKPQPGMKVDYASYLRAPARSRAWMHASGAIVTKVVPFAVLPYAYAIGADLWAIALIAAFGVFQIVSDVLFSVKASDWKKFRREMRLAHAS